MRWPPYVPAALTITAIVIIAWLAILIWGTVTLLRLALS
jgi:hypothetical protein